MSVLDGLNTRFLTADELAEILRCSRAYVLSHAASGDIPGAIKPGPRWLFKREVVEAWLASLLGETVEGGDDDGSEICDADA